MGGHFDNNTQPEHATCRDEIIACVRHLESATGRREFRLVEIVDAMKRRQSRYAESTVRTHVVSRMCAGVPQNHAVKYDDLVRVRDGVYKRRQT